MNSNKTGRKEAAKRTVGKKERRHSTLCEVAEDDESKIWNTASRPLCAAPPGDSSFVLEDESLAASVEHLMYAFTISDPQLDKNPLVFVSPGFETMTGYSADEILGINCKVLQGKAPDADTVATLRGGLKQRRFFSCEVINYRRDGQAFHNLLSVVPMLDSYDNLLKFVGVQCDLDEKRKHEHVDEGFHAKWTEQVRQHVSALMITDNSLDSTPVVAVSTGFIAMTGYSQFDMLGCGFLCLAGPDTNRKAMKKLTLSQWSDKPGAVKMLLYKKDGTPFWAYVFSCPLTVEGRGATARQNLSIVVDITTTRLKRVGKYLLGKVIGTGASGTVRIGRNQVTDEIVAVKAVDASRFRSISEIEQIQEEMNVLSSLKHPHIIRLIEIHFINSIFFLIMEFASGGSLIKYIHSYNAEKKCLDEAEAHRLFLQTASALDYCHRRRITHRDLKPENILMDDKHNIKIADFGLAAVTAPFAKGLTLQCGTPEFTAPEIVTGKEYDGPSVDIWSMGVILYEAVTGSLPFKGATQAQLFKAIQRGVYDPLPAHISRSCKDLVRHMLTVDPATRFTMDDILRHPWCREFGSSIETTQVAEEDLPPRSPCGSETQLPDDVSIAETASLDGNRTRSSCPASPSTTYLNWEQSERSLGRPSCSGSVVQPRTSSNSGMAGTSGAGSGRVGLASVLDANGSNSVHDSVRVVLNDMDKDDPITAAILRGQYGVDFNAEVHYRSSMEEEVNKDIETTNQAALNASITSSSLLSSIRDRRAPGRELTPPRASLQYHHSISGVAHSSPSLTARSGACRTPGKALPALSSMGLQHQLAAERRTELTKDPANRPRAGSLGSSYSSKPPSRIGMGLSVDGSLRASSVHASRALPVESSNKSMDNLPPIVTSKKPAPVLLATVKKSMNGIKR